MPNTPPMINKLGTKAALLHALHEVCPGARIEEWFEYGADPYYFRVIVDLESSSVLPISHRTVMATINAARSARSVMADDRVILHSANEIQVIADSGYVLYSVRLCGTFPHSATQGQIENDTVAIQFEGDSSPFHTPATGNTITGTHPNTAVQGGIEGGNIHMGTIGESAAYNARVCGTLLGSLI